MTLLDMENTKSILTALNDLGVTVNRTPSPILEDYLREIAKHGLTFIPWSHIKPLILQKFNRVMDEFIGDVNSNSLQSTEVSHLRERVYKAINQFEGTPFTIQRICELLTEPRKNYTRPNKFLRGFEKACLIVSTIDCYGNKIYNVDPRLSGSIVKSSPITNGSSTECGSNSSVEDSCSGNKHSDEDVDEDNSESTEPLISARRPCINFYRSLTDRCFSSKLIDSHQKSMKNNLVGSYSPGIPGKHTLQRPFLSGCTSSSFRPILEESSVGDGFEERGNKQKGEAKMDDATTEGEETRTETTKPTVPPIDQMLRPMGQLEAFVNTISMATSPPSSITTTTVTVSADPHFDELRECCTEIEEEKLTDVDVSSSAAIKMSNAEVKSDDEPRASALPVEDEAEETASVAPKSSLKRESLTFNEYKVKAQTEEGLTELMASPAKRLRTYDKEGEEDKHQGESHSTNVESLSMEVVEEHIRDESILKQMIEKGNE